MVKQFQKVKYQLLAAFSINLIMLSQGCNIGWFSPTLPLLVSDQTPLLDGPLSIDIVGWVGACLSIGGFFGTICFGFLSNFIGYKRSIQLSVIPMISCWLLVLYGTQSWHIILSRLLSGVTAGAGFACNPAFVAEIASDFIRGRLNAVIQINIYTGVLLGFIGGSFLSYQLNPWVMLICPILFISTFSFMPDSPQFLLRKNKVHEAEKSLRFYRNCNRLDKDDELELQEEFEKFKAIAKQNELAPKLQISEFLTPTALKAMMISPFLLGVSQFSGSFAITSYANTIFKETGSTIDPNLSSIFMGVIQVIGTYIASMLVDNVGRKLLLIISTSGGCVALVITGVFSYLARQGVDVSSFNLLPMFSISFYILICAFGILPVPYILIAEVLPQRIRRIGATICVCTVFIFQSTLIRIFPILLAALDLYGCMWLFASVSTIGLLFTIFVVEETKGKNLDVLQQQQQQQQQSKHENEERVV